MPSKSQKILHLYNRVGFGLSFEQFRQIRKGKLKKELVKLLEKGVKEVPLIAIPENPFIKFKAGWEMRVKDQKELNKAFSKEVKDSSEKIKDLNEQWMRQLINPDTEVREKLTLFWHDHFAVKTNNGYHAQLHNNLLRKYALGKYGDLLRAVAKDPAMLQFLNNQQNNKRKPNENFARELLELFTLGRGNYTESDIKAAAKAFTGWKFDRFTCQFRFVNRQHDITEKEFMGYVGNFNGEDIIDIILTNKMTAYHLSAKLFQYYVSDDVDEKCIHKMADRLFASDYDMRDMVYYIFKSDWFYEKRFINSKIKSPQELLHGVRQHFGLRYEKSGALIYLQRSLGQRLFFPPGVNGWPVGREWINSSSLVNRMRLVSLLAKNIELGIRVKGDLDAQKRNMPDTKRLLTRGEMNYTAFEKELRGKSQEEQIDALSAFLINKPLGRDSKLAILNELRKQNSKESVKWLAIIIAGLPEYQLA